MEYVQSGFKKISTMVIMRTDSKQTEIEHLNLNEIEIIFIYSLDIEIQNESNENLSNSAA